MAKKMRPKSISRTLREALWAGLADIPYSSTREQYENLINYYVKFCREQGYTTVEDISQVECIQEYADALAAQGKSAYTIHSYVAAVCHAVHITMDKIDKPMRRAAEVVRGRSAAPSEHYRSNRDLDCERWERLVKFQEIAGLRRSELQRLKKESLVEHDGYLCLEVYGKGNKHHFQRLTTKPLGEDAETENLIRSYFAPLRNGERVFTAEEFSNRLNLHALRAKRAQQIYEQLKQEIKHNPARREELLRQMERYWAEMNKNPKTGKPRRFPYHEAEGTYFLRGKNKQLAKRLGKETQYDKLLTLYVSMFHLSHWRNDTTVNFYLLANV